MKSMNLSTFLLSFMHTRRILIPSIAAIGGGTLVGLYLKKRPGLLQDIRTSNSMSDAAKKVATTAKGDAQSAAKQAKAASAQKAADMTRSVQSTLRKPMLRRTRSIDDATIG